MATIKPEVKKVTLSPSLVLSGLDAGNAKVDSRKLEKLAKDLLKDKYKAIEAAKAYLIKSGATITPEQLKRLNVWYKPAPVASDLTPEKLIKKYADISDATLVELLKARGYKTIKK